MSQQYIAYSSRGGSGSGGVTSLNSLVGGLTLAAGSGITITDDGLHTITITASAAASGNLTDTGTDGIVITGGTGAVLGSGTSIAQHVADTTHNGYLSSTDWNTFNSKQAALTLGNITDVGTDGIVITGGTSAIIGSGVSLAQHVADTTHNGYLSSTDWNTFNGKQAAGNYITALTSDVTASGPGSATATIANGVVSNVKMANMATGTAKANISGSTGAPSDVALVSTNTASSIVLRDASGNFSAATITAALTGAASLNLLIANNLSDVNNAATAFNNISGLTTLGDLVYGGTSGARSRLAGNTTSAKQYLSQTGTGTVSAAPAWASISAADILAGTLPVGRGGTGATTLTAHGVLIGNTTSAVNITSAGSSGQVLTSNGASADPTFQAVAVTLANTSKSANYTLTDADDVVEVSAAGAWTLTLHDATTAKQKPYYIKRTDQALSNAISIATTSAQTVDGYASAAIKIATQYECFVLYPDGTNWKILDHKCITPWTSYNLTIGAATTPPTKGTVAVDLAQWRRVGDSLEFWYVYRQTAAGSAGSGQYKYPLPSGATIDTNKVDAGYGANGNLFASLGKVFISLGAAGKASVTMGEIVAYDTSNLALVLNDTASSNIQSTMTNGNQANINLGNTNVAWSIKCSVPISGWIE